MNRKYSRLIWSYYREFFGLPKVILTIALVYGVHTVNNLIVNSNVFLIIAFSFLLISLFYTFKRRYDFKQKTKKTEIKWLFEDIMLNRDSILLFLLPSGIINFFNFFQNNFELSEWSLIISETAFVLVGLLVYIQLMIVPKRVAEDLAKTYPEYCFQKV